MDYPLAAGNIHPGPHYASHGILLLDPRPSRHRPAGANLHRESESEAVGNFGRVAQKVCPLFAQTVDRIVDTRPAASEIASMEELDSTDSCLGDGFEILAYSILADIAVYKVEPGLRVVQLVGLVEFLFVP